jgi:polyhydroxyalkanoate synthesis regulator phasin
MKSKQTKGVSLHSKKDVNKPDTKWDERVEKIIVALCSDGEINAEEAVIKLSDLLDEAYQQGKRDGRSTASFLGEIERVKKEAEEVKKIINRGEDEENTKYRNRV